MLYVVVVHLMITAALAGLVTAVIVVQGALRLAEALVFRQRRTAEVADPAPATAPARLEVGAAA